MLLCRHWLSGLRLLARLVEAEQSLRWRQPCATLVGSSTCRDRLSPACNWEDLRLRRNPAWACWEHCRRRQARDNRVANRSGRAMASRRLVRTRWHRRGRPQASPHRFRLGKLEDGATEQACSEWIRAQEVKATPTVPSLLLRGPPVPVPPACYFSSPSLTSEVKPLRSSWLSLPLLLFPLRLGSTRRSSDVL